MPSNPIRRELWRICEGSVLSTFIMACIIMNIATMAIAYDTSPVERDDIVD